MNKIFELQEFLQHKMHESKLDHVVVFNNDSTVGDVYDAISSYRFFVEEEITELLEEMGDGSRDIHKPWKPNYKSFRAKKFESTPKIKEEAVDMLCFAINICLAAGLTHENIGDEYLGVYNKNVRRLGLV